MEETNLNVESDKSDKTYIIERLDRIIDAEVRNRIYTQKLQLGWRKLIIDIYKGLIKELEDNKKVLQQLKDEGLTFNTLEYEGYIRGFISAKETIDEVVNDWAWDYGDENMVEYLTNLAKEEMIKEENDRKNY